MRVYQARKLRVRASNFSATKWYCQQENDASEADAVEVGKSVDSGGSAGSAACSAGRSAAADGVWAESAGEAKVG